MSFRAAILCIFVAAGGIPAAEGPKPPAPFPSREGAGRLGSEVDFERHVVSLFGRAGCNTGACHGSFQGKGGLRLSLFGYEPDRDFRALTRDAGGRRVQPFDPDHSLMLLKATGQVPHGGGRRIAPDSWQYDVLRSWIAGGCQHQSGSGTVVRLEVEPREINLILRPPSRVAQGVGGSGSPSETDLRVRAVFADSSSADVAMFCDFRAKDESIAEVSDHGRVTALRPGDTAVVVSYRGSVQSMRVFVPASAEHRTPNTEHRSAVDR
jgi:hypothetical protein